MCRPGVADHRLVRFVKRWLRGSSGGRRRTSSENGSGNRTRCCSPTLSVSDLVTTSTAKDADAASAAAADRRAECSTAVDRSCVDLVRNVGQAAGPYVGTAHRKSAVRTGADDIDVGFICCCRSRCTSLTVEDCLGGGPEVLGVDDYDEQRHLTSESTESNASTSEVFCYCDGDTPSNLAERGGGGSGNRCSCRCDAAAVLRKRSKSSACCHVEHQSNEYRQRFDVWTSAPAYSVLKSGNGSSSSTTPAADRRLTPVMDSSGHPFRPSSSAYSESPAAAAGPSGVGSVASTRRPSPLHRYPPSIALSADGEESPRRRASTLTSVLRPNQRDCVGPPPNRVAPSSPWV